METIPKVPIFTYIPPVKYYDELKIDPVIVIDKFIGIIERLYGSLSPIGGLHNNWIGFYLWLCEVLKNKGIEAVYVYGSSVYRMDNPHDITDIDMFILSKEKVNLPEELKEEVLHVQMLSNALLTHEVCGLSQQLLVLKTSKNGEMLIERARKIFNEDYLFALILRDVYKVCATKKISDIKDGALKEKIMGMRLNPKTDDQESPYFVREMLKNRPNGIEEGELLTLLDFSFRRRKVKPKYAEKVRERAKVFWKTGKF